MYRILLHSAIGLMFLAAGLPTQAQSNGPTAGTQMGRGTGQGAGRGAGQGAGRGATMPERGQGWGQNQGDMFTLVGDPAVQNELKLDAQQREKLRALGKSEHARQAAQMLSQRGSCERTDDRRAVMAKVRNDIEEILSPSQWKRLNEIWVQVRGVRALQSERIAKTLELTQPQQKQIAQLLSGGFRGRAAQIELQVLDVLNENQRQQFVALQGVPFQRESTSGGGPDGVPPRDGRGRMQRQP